MNLQGDDSWFLKFSRVISDHISSVRGMATRTMITNNMTPSSCVPQYRQQPPALRSPHPLSRNTHRFATKRPTIRSLALKPEDGQVCEPLFIMLSMSPTSHKPSTIITPVHLTVVFHISLYQKPCLNIVILIEKNPVSIPKPLRHHLCQTRKMLSLAPHGTPTIKPSWL